MCITDEIPDSPVYVTLSYVWGNLPWSLATYTANYDSLRKPGSLNLHEYAKAVPRTISDAIGLCRGMGIPYFWVDKLCIVQDDESNLRDQISIMDQIYKHSYFTLICADGNDANHGLPGVGGTPRAYRPNAHLKFSSAIQFSQPIQEESETSPWHQRAWTLQERALSSRTLVFHDQTVYWQCATITWYETSSADEQVDRLSSTLNRSGIGRLPRFPAYALSQVSSLSIFDEKPIPNFIDYVQLVGGYSARLLGFPSDAERAFSAILHELSRSFHGGFFYGLPTLLFDVSLLWVFQEEGTPQRRAGFPSWSWLGWEAPVYLISMVGHTPINADDMWNPWELFDHENGGIPTSSNFDWRSFEPLTTWWRVSKDGRRSYISNSHSSWLRFRDDVSAGDWRRHSLNYFKHRESWDHWYYPINDSDTNATIGDRSHTRWKLLPRRDNLEEAGLAGPDETEGWEEDTTEFYTNGNWPGLFFRHPFPVVENVERMAESSDEWLPFLEFRTQSFRLKPVHIISGGDVGRDKILHLEHEAFPGNLLGELHPNDSVNPESLLGTDCEFITLARLSHPVRLGGYRDVAEYAVAALWIDWADGVAYRKGLAFLYGPRWERTPDDTGMTETVHSFEDCPHVMRDVRLG
ncbi:hypothetical protein H2200_012221 [Cladophialophora chaetospira]|uniref:Heterokaryon incompatibility domain-containing protein n=1 Tax=Cladophialophora chaetospira TaxID=386627 RepID=A0AA38WYG0_9EURO|nr:hypothetical protein H2200_012221 [Cladophialophora chaetospira]